MILRPLSDITSSERIEFGDWQTPLVLARESMAIVKQRCPTPNSIVEPTCGVGAFLQAASEVFPSAKLVGYDISRAYVEAARAQLPAHATVEQGDFFELNWDSILRDLPEPILVVGNPPWVTSAALGARNATNLPKKSNIKGLVGLDAITGKSNFDISEWMLLRLLEQLRHRSFTLAMLCKGTVARKTMELVASKALPMVGEVRAFDAKLHFSAAVDAVHLLVRSSLERQHEGKPTHRWPVYTSLAASVPSSYMGVIDGRTYSDVDSYVKTKHLEGHSEIEWRSGIKHDCSKVMELTVEVDGRLSNGLGENVVVEPAYLFPLSKGSDLANGRTKIRRFVIVPQRRLGEDTKHLQTSAPLLWRYLEKHRVHLDSRKSSIYRKQPPFSIFGIGPYSFSVYKVGICGLYKKLTFSVIGPHEGQPVMVDDTAYFLPCQADTEAASLARALNSSTARDFFSARVFWDGKRPISKALLQSLSLEALLRQEGERPLTMHLPPEQPSLGP